jgi:hypothetical protein
MLGGRRVDSSGPEQQEVAGCCVYGNEPLGYIKCGGICLVSQKLLAFQELCFMQSVSMHYSDTRVATACQAQGAGEITVSSTRVQQADRKPCFETPCTETHNYMKLGEQK